VSRSFIVCTIERCPPWCFPCATLEVSLIFRNDNDRMLPLLRRRGVGVKASLILRIDCLIASGSSDSNALIMLF
jgi:hypothetical protein